MVNAADNSRLNVNQISQGLGAQADIGKVTVTTAMLGEFQEPQGPGQLGSTTKMGLIFEIKDYQEGLAIQFVDRSQHPGTSWDKANTLMVPKGEAKNGQVRLAFKLNNPLVKGIASNSKLEFRQVAMDWQGNVQQAGEGSKAEINGKGFVPHHKSNVSVWARAKEQFFNSGVADVLFFHSPFQIDQGRKIVAANVELGQKFYTAVRDFAGVGNGERLHFQPSADLSAPTAQVKSLGFFSSRTVGQVDFKGSVDIEEGADVIVRFGSEIRRAGVKDGKFSIPLERSDLAKDIKLFFGDKAGNKVFMGTVQRPVTGGPMAQALLAQK